MLHDAQRDREKQRDEPRTLDRARDIAIAMCEADHGLPYERVEIRLEGQTPTHLVVREADRWEMYLPEARRFLAAMRALASD
jgi:hypothetical protein